MDQNIISVEEVGLILVIVANGAYLDLSNRDNFRSSFEASIGTHKKVLLDLSKVRFVDSSGLGSILAILKRIRTQGGEMAACGMAKPVKVLFDLVRLDRVLVSFADRESAFTFLDKLPVQPDVRES